MLYIHWSPDPVAFSIGPLSMNWYGMTWGLAILSAYWILQLLFKREGLDDDKLVNIVILFAVCGLIGARLGEVFFYKPAYFLKNPIDIIKVWEGGLASHGGIFGGIFALWLSVRLYKEINFWSLIDKASIAMLLAAGLIRLGNLFNSELYGKVTDVPWAFVFERVDDQARHPSVLYEAIMVFILFAGLMWLFYNKPKWLKAGFFTGFFFSVPFVFRFLLEFTKDNPAVLGPVSWTQLLSLPVIVFGTTILVLSFKGKFVKSET